MTKQYYYNPSEYDYNRNVSPEDFIRKPKTDLERFIELFDRVGVVTKKIETSDGRKYNGVKLEIFYEENCGRQYSIYFDETGEFNFQDIF